MKASPTLLGSALIANLFLSGACPQPQPITCEKQRPVQIEALAPPENSLPLYSDVNIGVAFDVLPGRRPINLHLLQLVVDKVNVTKQARVSDDKGFPNNQDRIFFTPPKPLSPGRHTAEVRFVDGHNKQYSYTWNFYIPLNTTPPKQHNFNTPIPKGARISPQRDGIRVVETKEGDFKIQISKQRAAFYAGLGSWAGSAQPQPPTCERQKPIQLDYLFPGENATVIKPKVPIGANFDLLIGPHPILSQPVLLLDGVDVTKQAQYSLLGDIPASSSTIGFEPPKPLSPGKHTAEVRFADDQGKQYSYTWNFYVLAQ
jgi:hypothetical protein